jgi:pimeloyl-ACP methyl ester carboxylesterase
MIHRLLASFILLPDRYCYQVPEELGLAAEVVTFPNARGTILRGVLCQSRAATSGSPDQTRPVVLFCPGTAGNLSSHLHYLELLCCRGFTVLGFDYTGFGQSAGTAGLESLGTDVLSACDFLRQERKVAQFGIFGVSLGANLALHAAVLRPTWIRGAAVEGLAIQREVIRGLLTTGSMGPQYLTTMTCEGKAVTPRHMHVLNPLRVGQRLADVVSWVGASLFPFQGKDPQVQAGALADTPVLFIHGIEDALLPCEATLQVYERKPGAKRLWLIPGVGHAQEAVLAQDAEYAAQLGDFFYAALGGTPAAALPLPMSGELLAVGPRAVALQVYNPGPPGLALTTVVSNARVYQRTVWVQDHLTLPAVPGDSSSMASCLRLLTTAGMGVNAHLCPSARGQHYRNLWQSRLRSLSRTLHESRWRDLPALLQTLPQERPAAPFDFFLGLYCVQIMLRTRHKFPLLARTAAELFCWYWHYGGAEATLDAQPTLWDLASAILGERVGPRHTLPVGEGT